MKVHILYLTTDCNLRCPYCYEREKNSKVKKATYKQIDSFISSILEEEHGQCSTLCLLGGEPLLEFKKIRYIFDKCISLQKRNLYIALNLITNGTLIHKYLDDLREMLTSNQVHLSLDISYDGINQHLRTGKSDIAQRNMELLTANELPFGVSYTITENNCDYKILLEEVIYILERFFPKENVQRNKSKLKLSTDLQGISKILNISSRVQYFNPIRDKLIYLYKVYGVPICDAVCSICKLCDKASFTGKQYCVPDKDELIDEAMVTEKKFNHF